MENLRAEQLLAALSFLNLPGDRQQREDPELPPSNQGTTVAAEEEEDEETRMQREKEVQYQKMLKRLIPDWKGIGDIEKGQQHDDDNGDCKNWRKQVLLFPKTQPRSPLEQLGPDVSALILSHLTIQELSDVSLVSHALHHSCRTDQLWRLLFVARWKYRHSRNYYHAYQAGHANVHDLWVTHWNCVYPDDGDSPGRCCIPSLEESSTNANEGCNVKDDEDWMQYCPTCRYTLGNSNGNRLPTLVKQALEREKLYQQKDDDTTATTHTEEDPVQEAEVRAAAQCMLSQEDWITPARAVFAVTQYSIAKWCRRRQQMLGSYDEATRKNPTRRGRARHAFEAAATFHRTLSTGQYEADSLHFLTDVLFFSIQDSHLSLNREAQEDMGQLLKDVYGDHLEGSNHIPGAPGTVSHLGSLMETSHHSWHVVRLSNPDYVRPITFRVFAQRSDCFTVFPDQGYLEPGETCHLVFGVRSLGSIIAEAFEALNVQREEVDTTMADVYAAEAHLPYAPFAIRYMFAPVDPCIPPSFTSRGDFRMAQSLTRPPLTQAATSKYKHMVSYLWDNVADECTVRTIFISAHVHANYRLEDFQRETLCPFDIRVDPADDWGPKSSYPIEPLVFVAPNLLQKDPQVFHHLMNMKDEVELSDAGQAARTEKSCQLCSRTWGARSEELGRAYILQILICEASVQQENLQMKNLSAILRLAYTYFHKNSASADLKKLNDLLYVLQSTLVRRRAVPYLSAQTRRHLLLLESIVDELCDIVQFRESASNVDNDDEQVRCVWRHVGVYPHLKCTDSIFGKAVDLDMPTFVDLPLTPILKDELDYLEGFRYLTHSPGLYCLGQQQDPNHDDLEVPITFDQKSPHFAGVVHRHKRAKSTDIFYDSSPVAFASAMSLIHDPRSLIVHGVYDRVPHPGTIVRKPAFPSDLFQRASPRDGKRLMDQAYFMMKRWKGKRLEKPPSKNSSVGLSGETFSKNGSPPTCLLINDLDPDGHSLLHLSPCLSSDCLLSQLLSIRNYLSNIPAPGVGKFALSTTTGADDGELPSIVGLQILLQSIDTEGNVVESSEEEEEVPAQVAPNHPQGNNNNNQLPLNPLIGMPGRGPRVINLLWLVSSHFGWTVDESHGAASVLVDRRILIACQWVSNSLMALPLIWTLLARYVQWITTRPMDYHFKGLPFELDSEMRYLTPRESGYASILVVLLWLYMGRYAERRIGRNLERSMREHVWPGSRNKNSKRQPHLPTRVSARLSLALQRLWDRTCPLVVQRRVFTPRWNRRSDEDVLKHFACWRSKDLREHRSRFPAAAGQGTSFFVSNENNGGPPTDLKEESPTHKLLAGTIVSLGSFSASSPHFLLNMLTVFSCSIALGMSVSLQTMEVGRANTYNRRSILQPFGFNTVIIAFVLIGQLVGSSGGVLFLAEFVVTSISLLLGGAGTISASAMESWACFFCLSTTAFWGYLFARVGLADGIRHKRRGASSVVLCACLVVMLVVWISLGLYRWDLPPALMIVASSLPDKRGNRTRVAGRLQ